MAPCVNCGGYSFSRCYNKKTQKYDISKYGQFCSFSCSARYSEKEYDYLGKLKETEPHKVKEIKIKCQSGTLTILKPAETPHVD